MPNFKTHQYVNYIILVILLLILYYFRQINYLSSIFIIGYIIGTQYITPDLDIDSKPSKNVIWYIYKKLSHHRGKTHALFYGFIFPILYIMIILIVIIYVVGIITNIDNLLFIFIDNLLKLIYSYYIYIIIFIVGIGIANGIHIILDKMTKFSILFYV